MVLNKTGVVLFALFVIILWLATIFSDDSKKVEKPEKPQEIIQKASSEPVKPATDEELKARISPSALHPYDRKNYPKTFAKFGSRMKQIEQLRNKAALMALRSNKCDYIDMVELSDMSSTLDNPNFWIDCKNGERIYLDEKQIAGNEKVLTEQEYAWDHEKAVEDCRNKIRSHVPKQGNLDIHIVTGTSTYETPGTHRVVVEQAFDFINVFNATLKYNARCVYPPGLPGTIEISDRN